MKSIQYFIVIIFACLLLNSCEKSLNEYVPENDTEKKIVSLLNTYVDARNNGDIKILTSIFADNAKYIAGNGARWTKSQIANSDPEWWVQYGKVKLLNSEFKISENDATVTSTGKWGYTFKTPHITSLT